MRTDELLPSFVLRIAELKPDNVAIKYGTSSLTYEKLFHHIHQFAHGLLSNGITKYDRVAVYLEQRLETVAAAFSAMHAGAIFVPLNPLLRPQQIKHILNDSGAAVLVTSPSRLEMLRQVIPDLQALRLIVLVDSSDEMLGQADFGESALISWEGLLAAGSKHQALPGLIDLDVAAIFYTSGSTGFPKGVVLTHRNMVAGAHSVSRYLKLQSSDRLLCLLPLSFDAGFSQLTTSFACGGSAVLTNFLFAADVPRLVASEAITGICGVPPLWRKLVNTVWLNGQADSIRFAANTGGHMDRHTLTKLQTIFPSKDIFLMYGFTEAFRATYLDPSEVASRPDAIGKAIPNAEIMVVREDGTLCEPGEAGELVQRGALVARGYWGNQEATRKTFRPLANPAGSAVCIGETAAWSGDLVRRDADGYLYFVGRRDEMIKSGGYRISPEEIEAILNETGLIEECCVVGAPHAELGQAIVAIVQPTPGKTLETEELLTACRNQLPAYMTPKLIVQRETLQRNANGKIDRKYYIEQFRTEFDDAIA